MSLALAQAKAMATKRLYEIDEEEKKSYSTQREYYQSHPLDFIVDRLKVKRETIDWLLLPEYQDHKWDGTVNPLVKILQCLVANKWAGVESATGTGKTFLGAIIVRWFLESFENSIVVTTAPKQDQLTLHIWKEIGKLQAYSPIGELTTLRLRMRPNREDWIAVGFVAGVKANEDSSTKAQGFHAEHMLIILEETPGVPNPIITAFQNTCTSPHNLILAFGNPDHQLDNLHKFCAQDNVEAIRISAYDHPNVVLDNPLFVPGAASKEGINRVVGRFGKDNPLSLSRTRGISPAQANDALIRLEWCSRAIERFKSLLSNDGILDEDTIPGRRALGVDVANSDAGDKAAIAEGKGPVLIKVDDFPCPDSNQLGKRDVYLLHKEKKIPGELIGVDGIGVGAGTVNALKELEIKVVNLQSSESPDSHSGEEKFNNLRSQMWWQLRVDLKNDVLILPDDEDLIADLVTPKFSIQNGKIVVESKKEIKKRLGRSPNKGDAVVYWNWVRTGRRKLVIGKSEIY